MKKLLILSALFILPIVAYLFFASGVNHFAKLPILTPNVDNVENFQSLSGDAVALTNKITILGFLGTQVALKKGNIFNLNQKIYKRFYEFNDFQIVMVMPEGTQQKAAAIKEELNGFTDTHHWKFIFGNENQIKTLFNSLRTNLTLDSHLSTPYVFIIDKDKNLRGRKNDEDNKNEYGFDATSVAELNNKMVDDVKIILAEYRLELKKNNAYKNK